MRADDGLPGSPTIGFPATDASTVGLPGFTRKPCTITPGGPKRSIRRGVRSRRPTEEPPLKMMPSHSASAVRKSFSKPASSSGAIGWCLTAAPSAWSLPASAQRLESGTCAPFGRLRISTSSSPLEMIAKSGTAYTGTSTIPNVANTPNSAPPIRRPSSTIVSPGSMSEPAGTTQSPAAIVPATRTLPFSTRASSIGTTASAPGGRAPPVGMRRAVPGSSASGHSTPIRISPAMRNSPGVSCERTTKPSIAERAIVGCADRAAIGLASTRPQARSSGTISVFGSTSRARAKNSVSACSGASNASL